MIVLRPDQSELLDRARGVLRAGAKSILVTAPTGFGKTCVAGTMFRNMHAKNLNAWFVVHRRELLKQSAETLDLVGVPYGYIASGVIMDRTRPVQLCSKDSLIRRLELMPYPAVIVFDEAHHVAAESWKSIIATFPQATRIGLTATPRRADGAGLREFFGEMVSGPSVAWLIEHGHLADYRLFAPATPDLSHAHTRMGDYVTSEAEAIMDKPTITGNAVAHYARLANGRRAICRGVSIKHSIHIAEQFRAQGFRAVHVDGTTAPLERDAAIAKFRTGEVQVLCNVDLFNEGLDVRGIECAIDLRPTQSLTLWLQFCGRALRTEAGKTEALILDHAGNSRRHGLPDDEREWSLDGTKGERGGAAKPEVAVKQCPKCYATVRQTAVECRHCGHVFEVGAGREVEVKEGELKEVDRARARQQQLREQGFAQSEQDLVKIGTLRGYARPMLWARAVLRARAEKQRRRAA